MDVRRQCDSRMLRPGLGGVPSNPEVNERMSIVCVRGACVVKSIGHQPKRRLHSSAEAELYAAVFARSAGLGGEFDPSHPPNST